MTDNVKVAPSILSADFCKMAEAVENLSKWKADYVHCDVMDGVYVPNLTFGMPMVKALKKYSALPLDVHLMIVKPERYVGEFCAAGADVVTFHPEVCEDVIGALDTIKKMGKKCGLAVNADVPANIVEPYLADIDMLVIMTVQAGFGGQSFKAECLEKAEWARDMRKRLSLDFDIEIDGGVNEKNAELCKNAGANVLVAGSAVFGSQDPARTVAALK